MTRSRVGINGFGRMGRLALRAGWDSRDLKFVHINELHGDAEVAAHLLTFDSVHGRWERDVTADADGLMIDGQRVGFGSSAEPGAPPWDDLGVDVMIGLQNAATVMCGGHLLSSGV
jgi:glyceraldehyde 3-phosphate dehydrogenase